MSFLQLRRLSPVGCRIVGEATHSVVESFGHNGIVLPDDVLRDEAPLHEATQALLLVGGPEPGMFVVDTAVDGVVAGALAVLRDLGRVFTRSKLPLSAAQAEIAAAVEQLRGALPVDGTGFLGAPYDTQWEALDRMERKLREQAVAQDLALLGLAPLFALVSAHIDLYGRRLGVTAHPAEGTEEQTPMGRALLAWHGAFRGFALSVEHHFRPGSPALATGEELLEPYHRRAAQERQEERAAAERRAAAASAEEPVGT